jgi:hypothetical protein
MMIMQIGLNVDLWMKMLGCNIGLVMIGRFGRWEYKNKL